MKMELGEYGMTYLVRVVACLFLCVSLNSFGAISSFSENFESINTSLNYGNKDLSSLGWEIDINIHRGSSSEGSPYDQLWWHGLLLPNGTQLSGHNSMNEPIDPYPNGFMVSQIINGESNSNYLKTNNLIDHINKPYGALVSSGISKDFIIEASDIGSNLIFSFDSKRPSSQQDETGADFSDAIGNDCQQICNSSAFIHILETNNFLTTVWVDVSTSDSPRDQWERRTISYQLSNPELIGNELTVGFLTLTSGDENSAIYYDNLNFTVSEVPLPAGIYLFLSGLVGLGLMRGRN
jgi:hypothetical protein